MPQTKLITFMWVTPWPPFPPKGVITAPSGGSNCYLSFCWSYEAEFWQDTCTYHFNFFSGWPLPPPYPPGGVIAAPSGGQIAISASVGAMKLKFSTIFVHIILHFFSDWPHPLAPRGVFDAPRGIIAAPLRRSNCYLSFCWSYKTEIWLKT